MAQYQLSHLAEKDFQDILTYTLRTWGLAQAESYINQIESCCELVADNPLLGRECDWIAPGLRRIHEGRHVIFYRTDFEGLKIERILHENMLPLRYLTNKG